MKPQVLYAAFAPLSQKLLGVEASAAPRATLSNLTVTLPGYGSFAGTSINKTLSGYDLPTAVDAWLGVDYAAQPTGAARFTAVGFPEPFDGVKDASSYGRVCVQDPSSSGSYIQDEACLNFNVYRTAGVPMNQKLPVLVWTHGGSFITGYSTLFDGASFVASSKAPMVAISFHYRLNSLGFLPSTIFEEEGLLNLGLRDTRLFLEFLNMHVSQFGGDPDKVTLGGRSAGAHAVGIHYFHNYGETAGNPLFNQVLMQSGSITARAFPPADYPLYQRQFAEFMEYLGCPTADNTAALSCLRSADITAIRDISTKLWVDSEYNVTWPFQPALGGFLLEKPGSVSGVDGTFHHLPLLTSNVNDEGKFYAPGDLQTNEQFINFLWNISPNMTTDDIADLNVLYPDPLIDETSPYSNSPNTTQFDRISAALSDYMYICAGQESAYRAAAGDVSSVWKVRFNVPNRAPLWQGVPHGSDSRPTWNEPNIQYPEVSPMYHGYLSSFVTTGNPNTYRQDGTPEWPTYQPAGFGLDSEPASQLLVDRNGTVVEKDVLRREQCLWWRDSVRAIRLNK
ncbi:hypothetical protein N0V82_008823 [Gnomoniopsis sp. IMI 355080]|nr:hypothetical protein N0V82_008823 [Gnomoniopsis sp. IMI 355080]